MGDYTKHNNKIGSCGEAYYATKPMIEKLKNTGDEVVECYLDPAKNCSFAFPFPEYDGKSIGGFSNFHEDERVNYYFHFPAKIESHHRPVFYQYKPNNAVPMVNLHCECPYKNTSAETIIFRLKNQVYFDGQLCVSAECAYCKNVNIFTQEEAQIICEIIANKQNESDKTNAYDLEISNRILATYK